MVLELSGTATLNVDKYMYTKFYADASRFLVIGQRGEVLLELTGQDARDAHQAMHEFAKHGPPHKWPREAPTPELVAAKISP